MGPMPEWLTQSAVAERLGITPRQVHNLARSEAGRSAMPSEVRGGKRLYPWPDANQWYIDFKVATSKPAKVEDEREAAQTRKVLAEAALKELELAKEQGQLLDASYVEQQLTGILEALRSRILAARGRFAPQFVGIKTVGEAQLRLERMSDELMDALRGVGADPALDPDEDEEATADEPGEAAGTR